MHRSPCPMGFSFCVCRRFTNVCLWLLTAVRFYAQWVPTEKRWPCEVSASERSRPQLPTSWEVLVGDGISLNQFCHFFVCFFLYRTLLAGDILRNVPSTYTRIHGTWRLTEHFSIEKPEKRCGSEAQCFNLPSPVQFDQDCSAAAFSEPYFTDNCCGRLCFSTNCSLGRSIKGIVREERYTHSYT